MFRLRTKIALSFMALTILMAGVIIAGLYLYARRQTRQSIQQRLIDNAVMASLLIDADLHATLREPGQEDSQAFSTIRQQLDEMLRSNPDIIFAYTMRYVGSEGAAGAGQVIFVVDSMMGPGEPAGLGEIYEEAEEMLIDYAANPQGPWAEEEFTTDEWGTVLTGYAPLYTSSGRVDGIVGIDMLAEEIRAYENQFLWMGIGIFAGVILLAAILGWQIGLSLTAPLLILRQDIERITAGEVGRRAQITSDDEIAELARAFNAMNDQARGLVRELEQGVALRTQELSARTKNLEAAAQLSQAMAAILDVDELMQQAVNQIRSRFRLYYVGLFMAEAGATNQRGGTDGRRWAVLKAGTGEAGQKMAADGYRIEIGRSAALGGAAASGAGEGGASEGGGMIGWCIANAQARIAQAAGVQGTRWEAALPLRSRGQVIGALSVQSERADAFDEQSVTTLQIMADQVAIALDNARLFTESQAALEAERRAYRRASVEDWARLTSQLMRPGEMGFHLSGEEIRYSGAPWTAAMLQAAGSGAPVQDEDGELALPVTVREQVIGVLSFRHRAGGEQGRPWGQQEIETLQTILVQVGQALESARLYRETQQRAAQEQLAGEVTARMRASLDVDTVIRTAIKEIGDKMDMAQVEVHLGI